MKANKGPLFIPKTSLPSQLYSHEGTEVKNECIIIFKGFGLFMLYYSIVILNSIWRRAKPLLTFDFGLRSFEGGLRRSWLSEKLQATIWVFEKGFRCPSGQSTGLQKGLFLFLMLANELCNESDFVNVGARGQMFLQHVIFSLVLSLKTVKHRAHLEAKKKKCNSPLHVPEMPVHLFSSQK